MGQQLQTRWDGEARETTVKDVMARHSSTFRWATYFLPPEDRDDARVLYALCRRIDDVADESRHRGRARRRLRRWRAELNGEATPRPLVAEFLSMARRRNLDVDAMLELVDGVASDLGEVRMATDGELIRYCYRVAGTVGVMMCAVLGVEDRRGRPHAIDLGVAMQLTNICRDVVEDARRNRVYLPASRLADAGLSADDIVHERFADDALAPVIEALLTVADTYYASADDGMWTIPPRARSGVLVASRLYRSIGERLRARGCRVRVVDEGLSPTDVAYWTAMALSFWCRVASPSYAPRAHRRQLHDPLRNLGDGHDE